MNRRRYSRPGRGRAVGFDAEPYRGKLVEQRGPRVGVVATGVPERYRHRVRDSLVSRRRSRASGLYMPPGAPAPALDPEGFRRGFIAGALVTGGVCFVVMVIGFSLLGGSERLRAKADPTAWPDPRQGQEATPAGTDEEGPAPDEAAGTADSPLGERERGLDELAREDFDGRDYGFEELRRVEGHNRKVLERGDEMLRKLGGER